MSDHYSASSFINQNYTHSNSQRTSPSPNSYLPRGSSHSNNHYSTRSNNSISSINSTTSSTSGQTQLWMGDLDPWWDEVAIKQIWSSILGDPSGLIQVKLIYNRNLQANQQGNSANSGYCFLTFNSIQAAQQALNVNGNAIPGTNRFFKLNWASAGQQQPQQQQSQSQSFPYQQQQQQQQQQQRQGTPGPSQSPEFSIFVGDLAPDVSDRTLFEFFQSQYPSCSSAKIMFDQVTGNSRGYGFVKFQSELEQNKALLEMQSAILNGRPIRVSTATKNANFQNRATQGPGGPQVQAAQSLLQQSQQQRYLPPQQFNPPLNSFTDSNNTTIFIGGLNVPISAEELKAYFAIFGDIVYCKVLDGKNCGFVQFVNRPDAERAMLEMQGFPIATSRLRLAWGQKYSQHQHQPSQQYQQSPQQQQVPQSIDPISQQPDSLYSSLIRNSANSFAPDNYVPFNSSSMLNNHMQANTTPHSNMSMNINTLNYPTANLNANQDFSEADYLNFKDQTTNRLNSFC